MGHISGGAYNSAVGFGIDVVDAMKNDSDRLNGAWIYFVGPFLGGIAAVLFCLLLRPACLKLYGKEQDASVVVAAEMEALANDPDPDNAKQPSHRTDSGH
jgi:hypothetical protein